LAALLNSGLWHAVAVRFQLRRSTAYLYPLTILLTILIVLDSVRRATFSGIEWKERTYHLKGKSLRHCGAITGQQAGCARPGKPADREGGSSLELGMELRLSL
jgi:hypothetical protein